MITHFKLSFLYFSNVYIFLISFLKCGILILHKWRLVFCFLFINMQPNYCSTSVGNPFASINVPVSERVPRCYWHLHHWLLSCWPCPLLKNWFQNQYFTLLTSFELTFSNSYLSECLSISTLALGNHILLEDQFDS